MITVDDKTGVMVGGQELDEECNRRILSPKNQCPPVRPRRRNIKSQTQRVRPRRCSKCHDLGHYKNTCRNPRANVDDDYLRDVVTTEDLLQGNLPCQSAATNS